MFEPDVEARVLLAFESLFDLRYKIFFNFVLLSDQLEFMSTFGVPDETVV